MRYESRYVPVGKPRAVLRGQVIPFIGHRNMKQVIDDEAALAKRAHPTQTRWGEPDEIA